MNEVMNSKLFISARSPFARRVRLAFLENEIPFEIETVFVLERNEVLAKFNPLSRVPTLVLKSGEVLCDSNGILQLFYESGLGKKLQPEKREDLLKSRVWSCHAVGLMEKAVEYFLETLREKERQDPTVFAELKVGLNALFVLLEEMAPEQFVTKSLTQADIDMACALAYYTLRCGDAWQNDFPRLAKYWKNLEKRPHFISTFPPA